MKPGPHHVAARRVGLVALCLAVVMASPAQAQAQAPPSAKVMFLGDSVMWFWRIRDPDFFRAHRSYVVRGVVGETSTQIRLRAGPEIASVAPAVVVILGGGRNDDTAGVTPEATRDSLAAIVKQVRDSGARPVLCGVTTASPVLNALLADYAQREGVAFVDFAALRTPDGGFRPGLTLDGLHPSPEGYKLMDPPIEAAVEAALAAH